MGFEASKGYQTSLCVDAIDYWENSVNNKSLQPKMAMKMIVILSALCQ